MEYLSCLWVKNHKNLNLHGLENSLLLPGPNCMCGSISMQSANHFSWDSLKERAIGQKTSLRPESASGKQEDLR